MISFILKICSYFGFLIFKELEDFCFSFMLGHLTAVTQTSTFKDLDGETVKKFIIKAGKAGAFNR